MADISITVGDHTYADESLLDVDLKMSLSESHLAACVLGSVVPCKDAPVICSDAAGVFWAGKVADAWPFWAGNATGGEDAAVKILAHVTIAGCIAIRGALDG